jgi:hypothetical protein
MLIFGVLATMSGAWYIFISVRTPAAEFNIDKGIFVALVVAKFLASAGEALVAGIALRNLDSESKRNLLLLAGVAIAVLFAGCHILSGFVANDFTWRALLIDMLLPVLFVAGMLAAKKEDTKGNLEYDKNAAIQVEVDED